MNPLNWKPEHQIAFAVAIGLGALVGCIFRSMVTPSYVSFRWGQLWCDYGYRCIYLLQGYWLLILFWMAIGGAIGEDARKLNARSGR
jgi:hypothetical protein